MSEHERPVEPFSDLHVESQLVRATLLHDPTVEHLDVALYLDGSGSMRDEYQNQVERKGGGIFFDLFGWGEPPTSVVQDNEVEPQARWILEYLASKDRNGELRVAYWACGTGNQVEQIGTLSAKDAKGLKLSGPKKPGNYTYLLPALLDFETYMASCVRSGAKQGCAVIITDGEIHDAPKVMEWTAKIAAAIVAGRFPRINLVLVGVGDGINEEQLEEICHEEYPEVGHLWCHRVAAEIKQVAELVAVLVDETMTVAAGGLIYDDKGNVIKKYEGRLPAVLEFEVPEGCTSFTLEVGGKKYTQPLPDGDQDADEDHG